MGKTVLYLAELFNYLSTWFVTNYGGTSINYATLDELRRSPCLVMDSLWMKLKTLGKELKTLTVSHLPLLLQGVGYS